MTTAATAAAHVPATTPAGTTHRVPMTERGSGTTLVRRQTPRSICRVACVDRRAGTPAELVSLFGLQAHRMGGGKGA